MILIEPVPSQFLELAYLMMQPSVIPQHIASLEFDTTGHIILAAPGGIDNQQS